VGPHGLLPVTSSATGSNALLNGVVGPNGILALTSASGTQTALDPLIGPKGLIPLTNGSAQGVVGASAGGSVLGGGLLAPLAPLLGTLTGATSTGGTVLSPVTGLLGQ